MKTTLNTEMVVIVSPMGRDIAAFAYPGGAYAYVKLCNLQGVHYRFPSGKSLAGNVTLEALTAACEGEA